MPLLRWIFVLAILPAIVSHGQSIDALKDSLKLAYKDNNAEDVDRYLLLIANKHLENDEIDSALDYSYRGLRRDHAREKHDLNDATLFNTIAIGYERKGNLDSAIVYYNGAIDIYKAASDTIYLPMALSNLGWVYYTRGQYERSISMCMEALSYLELHYRALNDGHRALANIYNTIGSSYNKLGDLSSALFFNRKALRIRIESKNLKGIATSYNNIGNVFGQLKRYDSAVANLQRALTIRERLDVSRGSTLSNLGDMMLAQRQYNEAERYYFRSLQRKRLENDHEGLPVTFNGLADVFIQKRAFGDAAEYLKQGDSIARAMKLMQPLKDNLELKMTLYDSLNDPNQAFLAARELLVVKDSLLNEHKSQSVVEMKIRYESEKSAQEIELYRAQESLYKNRIKMLVIVVSLTVVVALSLVYSVVVTRRSKKNVELLLKELHHRVKNNLQVLSSVLSLQSQQLTDRNAIQAVKSSEGRVNAMALIHRKLYLGDTNRTIDIKDYVTELVGYLVHTYGYHDRELKLDLQIEPISVDVDKAIPLGLILNELISNAFKYAYAEHAHPELYVGVSIHAPGALMIQVRDNGKGMPEPKKDAPVSFGLKMVNTLIRELRGSLDVTATKGTTYILNIPL